MWLERLVRPDPSHGWCPSWLKRVRVRDITNDEGNRLLRIVRRSTGSVVTWRRAQMVLLSAHGMETTAITQVAFTSADRVRDVIHNVNADGFDLLYPWYAGGRPPKFTAEQRASITRIALARPARAGRLLSRPSRPGRPAPTLTTRSRRTACWSCTRSPTASGPRPRRARPW